MSTQPAPHPVTIVVPVYGDIPSLVACVESLKKNVDQSVHRVLLMNDCGPEADEIEKILSELITNEPGFFYERNPENLGFVGNCNRAAFEVDTTNNDLLFLNSDTITTPGFVDELAEQLHASPENGAVCARSNNATIASLPYKLRDPAGGRSIERTAEVHAAVAPLLPPSSVSPVAMGFCILIRRDLINRFGLFDDVFSPGYGEENDFCLRIAQQGYSSLIAHRALVFHLGSLSFVGPRRDALRASHEKLLVERYPHYPAAIQSYIHRERDVVDVFADALAPGDDIARVLIDIDEAPRGRISARDASMLTAAVGASRTPVDITVSVPDKVVARVRRSFPRLRIVRQSHLDGLWDLAVVNGSELSPLQCARLNRTSLRWVVASEAGVSPTGGFENAVVDGAAMETSADLKGLIETYGRSTVSIEDLRSRWTTITRNPDYLDHAHVLRESLVRRVVRRFEKSSPAAVGWAKAIIKRVAPSYFSH